MHRHISLPFLSILMSLCMSLSACQPGPGRDAEPGEIGRIETTVPSRGVAIPASLVIPAGDGAHPLVVMAHGHGGSRHEGGGYRQLADALAARGIASIRVDFPGCGDSSEAFTENNLSNMLLDLQAARDYTRDRPDIDQQRVGLLGYSMGGRLAVLLAEIDASYRALALWTPAVEDGARRELESLGGADAYQALKEQARRTGVAGYTTRWGTDLQLGYRWFIDLEETRPLQSLGAYHGPLLVLYGDRDDVVLPQTSEAAIAAASNSSEVVRHVVAGADHALGFYTNEPDIASEVVTSTAEFFAARL